MSSGTGFLIVVSLFNLAGMVVFYLLMKSRFSTKKILAEIQSEVDKLVADLGREADRDVALLESRIKSLRALMDEVDRRIILAGKEDTKRKAADLAFAEVSSSPAAVESRRSAAQARRRDPELFPRDGDTLESSVPSDRNSADSAGRDPSTAGNSVKIYSRPAIRRSEKMIEPAIPVRERVLDLSLKGLSAELIAHTLSISLGEVELILDMNDSSL